MKECYGKIYPDLSRVEYNKVLDGKVFKIKINCTGLTPQSRQLEYELKEWEDCQRCNQFQSCYELSNSQLLLRQAMVGIR